MAILLFSYSHADEDLRDRLETHLAMLKRQGVIETFHDRRLPAGSHLDHSISAELEHADVILLLVSPDFLASAYCYDVELKRALERHERGEAKVIPVILRHCDWHPAPFGKLLATPRDGKPVKSFPDLDEAFLQVTQAIRQAVGGPAGRAAAAPAAAKPAAPFPPAPASGPRSSNLRLPRSFTDADKDRFRDEALNYIATYFENSLNELAARNPGIQVDFRRINAEQFTATGYKDGRKAAWCRVFTGRGMMIGGGIAYSAMERAGPGSYNEHLSIEADAEGLYLRSSGMASPGNGQEAHLRRRGRTLLEPVHRQSAAVSRQMQACGHACIPTIQYGGEPSGVRSEGGGRQPGRSSCRREPISRLPHPGRH